MKFFHALLLVILIGLLLPVSFFELVTGGKFQVMSGTFWPLIVSVFKRILPSGRRTTTDEVGIVAIVESRRVYTVRCFLMSLWGLLVSIFTVLILPFNMLSYIVFLFRQWFFSEREDEATRAETQQARSERVNLSQRLSALHNRVSRLEREADESGDETARRASVSPPPTGK